MRRILMAGIVAVCGGLTLAQAPNEHLPADDAYVVVRDGHLTVQGQRQRYWAVIGKLFASSKVDGQDTPEQRKTKVENARRGTETLLQRFEDLGFNSARLWEAMADQEDYHVGDGSRADDVDYFVKRAAERGMRLWFAGLNSVGEAVPEDSGIIDDPATADAWREAAASGPAGKMPLRNNLARTWDPRLEAIALRRMTAIATHRNKHTGLRWCDDPVFAVWELSNEEWWMRKMVGGGWQKLPPFFRNQLIARWNEFLQRKYGSDEQLAAAWERLLPGESVVRGSVLLAPMAGKSSASASINDASEHALKALESLDQEYDREDFAAQRGSDVLEFFMGLQLAHKQREAATIKALGKSTRLSPMIYDTGIGYEIQSQFLHQHADAVAHDAYVNGVGPRLEERLKEAAGQTDPQQRLRVTQEAERISGNVDSVVGDQWVNWLLKPPGISQGVPWLEHNRTEGKPFLCYETQIQQPAKYRADFPLRIAALASIQDWDWICWHYFGDASLDQAGVTERPFDKPLDVTTGSHPQGYHYTYDEVQGAMMRAAGYLFCDGLLAAAKNPTTFVYGRNSLYDTRTMTYGGSYGMRGLDMLQTVYQYGARIRIDPAREDDEVFGPVVSINNRHTHNPYTPTQQITLDWKKGTLTLDSPAATAFAGLMANVGADIRFAHDVTLNDVKIDNPPGLFDPVRDDERYIAFAFYARDGKPLGQTRDAAVSLVSTSFNTGFRLGDDESDVPPVAGTLPVLVARVSGTIRSPHLDGMTYTFRDWHMNEIGSGTVTGGRLVVPAELPVFVVELKRQ